MEKIGSFACFGFALEFVASSDNYRDANARWCYYPAALCITVELQEES